MKKQYPILFFAGITVLMFWKVLFHNEFTLLNGRDTAVAYYPWFDVAAYWLKRGVMLLWDPYVYSGKFNMGEPQPGIFYPLNILFMLLPARGGGLGSDGMQLLLILDYFLAALFFYFLARSFELTPPAASVAGIAWAFSGFTVQIHGYTNVLSGFVWFPLALLAFRRFLSGDTLKVRIRQIALCALFLALSFLPGHHIPPIHIGLFLLFFAVFHVWMHWPEAQWKERILPFAGLAFTALGAAWITALQWVPSAEWARKVYRWIGEGPPLQWGQAVPYSSLQNSSNLSPQDALSLLIPYLSTNANIYVGSGVLFLALLGLLFARRAEARFFGLGAIAYVLMSWGRFSALHGWVNTFIPAAWFAREVFYYLILFQACLAMLAGVGLDVLLKTYSGDSSPSVRVFVRRAGWAMATAVLACGILLVTLHLERELPMDHPYMTGLGALVTYVAILGLLLYLLHTGRLRPPSFGVLAIGIIAIDLSSHISADIRPKILPENQENSYIGEVWKKTPAVEFLQSRQKSEFFRVDDPSGAFPQNYGDAWRLYATMGHGATALLDYFKFRETGWGPSSNATALLNVRYIVSRSMLPGMQRALDSDPGIYINSRAVPRAFVPVRYRSFANRADLLNWIPTPLFSPHDSVLLRQEDLRQVPPETLATMVEESGGIHVRTISFWTATEKRAKHVADASERRRLHLYRPAWGWSAGDEVTLAIRSESGIGKCYLVLDYFPTAQGNSRIMIHRDDAGSARDVALDMPGLQAGEARSESIRNACVDLGPIGTAECRFSFARPADCSANIDSMRIAKSMPGPEESAAGDVRMISYRPNQIKLRTELKRSAFIVASEVYYPGWEALLDGRPVPVLEADYILRAIPAPEGKHEITLRFRPRRFLWGLAASVVGIAFMTFLLIFTRGTGTMASNPQETR